MSASTCCDRHTENLLDKDACASTSGFLIEPQFPRPKPTSIQSCAVFSAIQILEKEMQMKKSRLQFHEVPPDAEIQAPILSG
jgi:hypothetical protein